MPYRDIDYRWEWDFQSSPEALWPLVSDTNRYNRDAGAPSLDSHTAKGKGLANRRRILKMSYLGVAVEYEEEPFEWIRPYRFGVYRRFSRGPVEFMRITVELSLTSQGGTRFVFQVSSKPKNILGAAAIPLQVGIIARRGLERTFRLYDDLIARGKLPVEFKSRIQLTPGGGSRLRNLRRELLEKEAPEDLLDRLVSTIEHGDDLTLGRIRPYALADYWRVPRKDVLELCLLATRVGLLALRWDILCPLCRGNQASASSLQSLPGNTHCESCNIDFTANFDRLVEVTFKPNPAIRAVEAREFCVGGPQVTPHIVAQQLLLPGDRRSLNPILEPGRYRLRTYGIPGGQFLHAAKNGLTSATFRADDTGWPSEEMAIGTAPSLRLENATAREQLFVLERMAWTDQAVTAAEVIAMQRFRDLFSNEVLRPGEQFSVGSTTIFFTDLKDSTRFYREVGDAPAFGYVVNHFDIMRAAISAEGGSVVKTMGDAVMAVFTRPAAALRAIIAAQTQLCSTSNDKPPWLKAGVHTGSCIAVTLNDRLDYFGTTVNVAARLQGLSQGGDIIISSAVHDDPEVVELLAKQNSAVGIEPIEGRLKGLEKEHFTLWRIVPKAGN